MSLLIRVRAWALKSRIVNLMGKTSGYRNRFQWLTFNEAWILHCVADRLTPEESVLYIVGKTFSTAEEYSDCKCLQFLSLEKQTKSDKEQENADEWFSVAQAWRDEGKVASERLQEFIKILSSAKSRWPEIFSGETPYVRKYWEIHYNYEPVGIATVHPATKPIATFDKFDDATKYVEEHSSEDCWWHSYDLIEAAMEGKIPEWEATPTPHQFMRVDEPGYVGYNPYSHESADCIFAMPHDSYVKWLDAVREGDIHRVNEVRNGCVYNYVIDVASWCVRYVEHEEPIDTSNPDANVPAEYLVDLCEGC